MIFILKILPCLLLYFFIIQFPSPGKFIFSTIVQNDTLFFYLRIKVPSFFQLAVEHLNIFGNKLYRVCVSGQTGIGLVVCHYPPYSSKWNPIEHRLFCHVHKAMDGVALTDYELVKELIAQTSTATGLTVVVRLNLQEYQTGIKVDKSSIDSKRILYHPKIPELNYRLLP